MPYIGKKPADIIATAVDTTTGKFSGEVDAASLDISGNIDVDGTTNLDVVDIDGAVDMASSLSVTGNLLVGGTTTDHQTGSSQEQLSYIAGDYFAVSRSSNDVAFFNRQSTDGSIINVRKDGTTVGSIGSRAGVALNIVLDPRTSGCGLTGVGQVIRPTDESGTNEDNTIDLGSSSHRFKDLYLSGGVFLGGTGSANQLDDYEEGTWTATITTTGTDFTTTGRGTDGIYIKVGKLVNVFFTASINTPSNGTGDLRVTGLPFTADGLNGSSFMSSSVLFGRFDLDSSTFSPHAIAIHGSTYLQLSYNVNGANPSMLVAGDINNNATPYISGSVTYRTT